jgi:hypothetical protein
MVLTEEGHWIPVEVFYGRRWIPYKEWLEIKEKNLCTNNYDCDIINSKENENA